MLFYQTPVAGQADKNLLRRWYCKRQVILYKDLRYHYRFHFRESYNILLYKIGSMIYSF